MSHSLLTENQRRHLMTYVHLLQEDLAQLKHLPEFWQRLPPGDRLHHAMAGVDEALGRLAEVFELPPRTPMDARRRVGAVANIWASRIPELRAGRLRGYGTVHPKLAAQLDPLVEDLTRRLFMLAHAASAPGEGDKAC
jgi:hypothetical protein